MVALLQLSLILLLLRTLLGSTLPGLPLIAIQRFGVIGYCETL